MRLPELWRWTGTQHSRLDATQIPALSRISTLTREDEAGNLISLFVIDKCSAVTYLIVRAPHIQAFHHSHRHINLTQVYSAGPLHPFQHMYSALWQSFWARMLTFNWHWRVLHCRSTHLTCMLRFYLLNVLSALLNIISYTAKFSMYALDHNTGAFITMNVTNSYGIAVYVILILCTASLLFEMTPYTATSRSPHVEHL